MYKGCGENSGRVVIVIDWVVLYVYGLYVYVLYGLYCMCMCVCVCGGE